MAIQESEGFTAMRLGWIVDGAQSCWRKEHNGVTVRCDNPRDALIHEQRWAITAREARRAKLPLWHWGLEIGRVLEDIPYG